MSKYKIIGEREREGGGGEGNKKDIFLLPTLIKQKLLFLNKKNRGWGRGKGQSLICEVSSPPVRDVEGQFGAEKGGQLLPGVCRCAGRRVAWCADAAIKPEAEAGRQEGERSCCPGR